MQDHRSRRAYHGSCHCGHIRYLVYITLPPATSSASAAGSPGSRIYKCNCSSCHKMGYFQIRPTDPAADFLLLSPRGPDPASELGDYLCFDRRLHWYFCPRCAVRCFTAEGCWRVDEVELRDVKLPEGFVADEGGAARVLRVDMDALQPPQKGYLAVNAPTVDQDQAGGEDLDLRELVDKRLVEYLDCKEEKGEDRVEYPHKGGTW